MKTTMKILPLMLGIMLFFTQCEKEAADKGSTFSEDVMTLKSDCEPVVQTLWAGAGQNDISKADSVGYVTATLLANNKLHVEYLITVDGYSLTEVHLWVGLEKSVGIFPNRAAPGLFPHQDILDFETVWSKTVDLDPDFDPSTDIVYVSAHGVVVFGEDFDGVYGLEGLENKIPETQVTFSIVRNTEGTSYHTLTLSQAGDFFNGVYDSYCTDPFLLIGSADYPSNMYSSLSAPEDFVPNERYNEVNWVINNISIGDIYVNGMPVNDEEKPINYADIQMAIWELFWGEPILSDPDNWYNSPAFGRPRRDSNPQNVSQIVAAALENPLFVPGCDDYLVIFLVPVDTNVQPHLIWKRINCPELGSETVWAYGEHPFNHPDNFIARKWGWIFEVDCTVTDE